MTILIMLAVLAAPADTLTLEQAYRAAAEHFPRTREAEIALAVRDLRLRNLETRYLPAVSVGGQAAYQSDVPEIPFSIPGADPVGVSRDQYRVGVTVDQLVYDGGLTSAQKDIERTAAAISEQQIAVDAYGIRQQVETAWFAVLLAEAERATLEVLSDDIEARLSQARSLVARGAATASNADVLEAEHIRVEQQLEAATARRRAGMDVLALLTGWSLPDGSALAMPQPSTPDPGARPERALFDLSRRRLDEQAALASRRTRPKVTTFVDAAYGRPQGNNVFADEFGPFVSLGVRVAWPFWDWRTSDRDRQALRLEGEAVTAREEAFLQGIGTAAAGVRRDIERLEAHMEGDAQIVALRARISAEARSRLDNGVITATDYLVERNAEHRARLAERVHRIQLAQARARLVTILGAS